MIAGRQVCPSCVEQLAKPLPPQAILEGEVLIHKGSRSLIRVDIFENYCTVMYKASNPPGFKATHGSRNPRADGSQGSGWTHVCALGWCASAVGRPGDCSARLAVGLNGQSCAICIDEALRMFREHLESEKGWTEAEIAGLVHEGYTLPGGVEPAEKRGPPFQEIRFAPLEEIEANRARFAFAASQPETPQAPSRPS